ncbi:hypothetical protein TNCV_1504331 [Trichonephila clavipes]|uniref:Uncharacterized protein n=1 Tax=Trichonephila clavipes TaxID=2585209 RepID=A0A8X6RTM7_TRICX|nr:hypothetical protein TNCV_1504331 [Trichonephila clavipes]
MVLCTTGDFTTRKRGKLAYCEIVESYVVVKPLVVFLHDVAVIVEIGSNRVEDGWPGEPSQPMRWMMGVSMTSD